MKLNKKMLVGLSVTPLVLMPTALSASCNQTDYDKLVEKFSELYPKLSASEKENFITRIDRNKVLTQEDRVNIIHTLNKNAGKIGSVVWFVKAAEAKVAQMQSYSLARVAFDNITSKATENKLDLGKVDKNSGKVSNPENDKFIPVVFMDIDETVFANEYSEAVAMRDGFSPSFKEKYDIQGKRKAIPGAIEFINHVFEKGGLVFFNSNMNQKEEVIKGLKTNLEKAGVKKQYIKDWMFWLKQVNPIGTKEGEFQEAPWMQRITDENEVVTTSKNVRMNAVSDNTKGWDFSKSDSQSGNAVKLRVIMKIGDDFNDFFDQAYKHIKPEERTAYIDKFKDLLTKVEGTKGKKVVIKDKKVEMTELEWQQFYVQTPGNAMYGGWEKKYNYGNYKTLWKIIEEIIKDPKDLK